MSSEFSSPRAVDLGAFPAAAGLLSRPALTFAALNGELARVLPAAAVGRRLTDLVCAFERSRVEEAFAPAFAGGEIRQVREVAVPLGSDESRRASLDLSFRATTEGVLVVAVDATERVAARGLYRLEKAKLDDVFANVSAALAVLRGPEAIYERTNAHYEQLFTDRILLGKSLLEALPELRGQKFPTLISSVFATGEAYREVEARALLRRTDAGALEERFFDQSYTRIVDDEGKPYGVLVQAIDVTERVTSREKLRAEEEKSARLLRLMPTPFFSVTADWVLNYINPAAEEVLGVNGKDLAGRTLWEIFPGLVGSRFGDAYVRAMREGVRIVTEDYYPDFDRWYEAWAFPFDRGLAVSFYDVTRRKRDELRHKGEKEKLEAIFHSSAGAMVFFRGPELTYEMVNARYAELVPGRALVGLPLLEALPELAGTAFPEIIRKVFQTGTEAVTHEELAPLRNPATGALENRYFDTAISRINDGEGKPYGVFVQTTEVTDRVQSRKRIEEALATRDTFLSIASHELRTPLTGTTLQAQLLKRALARDGSPPSAEWLSKVVDQIHRGLGRMARLIEDMLDISRIQSGKLALRREPTDLRELASAVVDRFEDELASAGIAVTVRDEGRDLTLPVDRFRIEQVLTNLLTNATKYAPGAPVSIELSARDEFVELVFHDGGPGIAEQDRERIFERFERLVTATHVGGLGLGLYIVRQIVDAHGGDISVAPDGGRGARFVLRLPRLAETETASSAGPRGLSART